MSNRYLSGEELVSSMNWSGHDVDLPQHGGLKEYAPDPDSWLQRKRIEVCHAERKNVLQEDRICKSSNLSHGEWRPDLERVEVTKQKGNFWLRAGYSHQGRMLLYPEEALFLVDSGMFEVSFGGIPLSLQQAFATLLGSSIPMEHYLVYAYLSRLGYIVRRHVPPKNLLKDESRTSYEVKLNITRNKCKKKERKRKAKTIQKIGIDAKRTKEDVGGNVRDPKMYDLYWSCEEVQIKQVVMSQESVVKELKEPFSSRHVDQSETTGADSCWGYADAETWIKSMPSDSEKIKQQSCGGLPCRTSNYQFPDISKHFEETTLCQNKKDNTDATDLMNVLQKWNDSCLPCPHVRNWKEFKGLQEKDLLKRSVGKVLWQGEVAPLLKPQNSSNTDAVLKTINVIENGIDTEKSKQAFKIYRGVNLVYDVYKPDHKFRKSDPSIPHARVCVARSCDPVPDLGLLVALWDECGDGVPVHWAVVDFGEVTFLNFSAVQLPTDDAQG